MAYLNQALSTEETQARYMETFRKADMVLSDLTSGGLLNAQQSSEFIRTLIDEPTILRAVTFVEMDSPQKTVNKFNFGSRVFTAASQDASADTATHAGRRLKAAARSKPTTSKVTLSTKEVIAQVNLPYEVVEDNIERDLFVSTVNQELAKALARDVDELIILGDLNATGGTDPFLDLFDGLIEQATANVLDAQNSPFSADIMGDMYELLPAKYRRNPAALAYFLSPNNESKYRRAVSNRQTQLGDSTLTSGRAIDYMGVPITNDVWVPSSKAILTFPSNVMVGFQRQIMIEMDKDITSRELIFVATARLDIKIQEVNACVKAINVA